MLFTVNKPTNIRRLSNYIDSNPRSLKTQRFVQIGCLYLPLASRLRMIDGSQASSPSTARPERPSCRAEDNRSRHQCSSHGNDIDTTGLKRNLARLQKIFVHVFKLCKSIKYTLSYFPASNTANTKNILHTCTCSVLYDYKLSCMENLHCACSRRCYHRLCGEHHSSQYSFWYTSSRVQDHAVAILF